MMHLCAQSIVLDNFMDLTHTTKVGVNEWNTLVSAYINETYFSINSGTLAGSSLGFVGITLRTSDAGHQYSTAYELNEIVEEAFDSLTELHVFHSAKAQSPYVFLGIFHDVNDTMEILIEDPKFVKQGADIKEQIQISDGLGTWTAAELRINTAFKHDIMCYNRRFL